VRPGAAPSAVETIVDDVAAVDLAAGPYTARFLPGLGMVGSSLTYDGDEHVAFDIERWRSGHTSGIPLLHPWANRLSRLTYAVDGLWVDLDGAPPLRLHDGLPIHGTMAAAAGWQVEAVLADSSRALLQARFVFGDHPDQLRSFPFPHELVVFVELSDFGLRVTTEVRNTGVRAVPVAFGWHPYLVPAGAARRGMAVVLPDRERLDHDGRGLPTGASKHEPAATVALGSGAGEVTFDDCYRLTGDRVLAVEAAGDPVRPARRRVEVRLDERYGYAQVYAPAGSPVVALEPMTAPVDALVSGDHRVVPPGERDTATFVIGILDLPTDAPPRGDRP
jgi:aldose 1-epimerase